MDDDERHTCDAGADIGIRRDSKLCCRRTSSRDRRDGSLVREMMVTMTIDRRHHHPVRRRRHSSLVTSILLASSRTLTTVIAGSIPTSAAALPPPSLQQRLYGDHTDGKRTRRFSPAVLENPRRRNSSKGSFDRGGAGAFVSSGAVAEPRSRYRRLRTGESSGARTRPVCFAAPPTYSLTDDYRVEQRSTMFISSQSSVGSLRGGRFLSASSERAEYDSAGSTSPTSSTLRMISAMSEDGGRLDGTGGATENGGSRTTSRGVLAGGMPSPQDPATAWARTKAQQQLQQRQHRLQKAVRLRKQQTGPSRRDIAKANAKANADKTKANGSGTTKPINGDAQSEGSTASPPSSSTYASATAPAKSGSTDTEEGKAGASTAALETEKSFREGREVLSPAAEQAGQGAAADPDAPVWTVDLKRGVYTGEVKIKQVRLVFVVCDVNSFLYSPRHVLYLMV